MQLPLLIVNFKTYREAVGEHAVKLAKIHEKVAHKTGVTIAIAVTACDLALVVDSVKIPVFSQHVDPCDFGAHTGFLPPRLARKLGAQGTLLNHSEHPLSHQKLAENIKHAKVAGLFTVACAINPHEGKKIMALEPDMIAIEPPELIGGDISVSKAKPDVIIKAVKNIGKKRVLVGAGIKTAEDVAIAMKLGASGILVASGIILAKDPEKALSDFAKAMKM